MVCRVRHARPKRRGTKASEDDEDSEEAKDSDQDAEEEAAAPAAADAGIGPAPLLQLRFAPVVHLCAPCVVVSTEGDEEVELSEEARARLRNLRNKVVVDEPLNKRQKRMHQMQEVAGKGPHPTNCPHQSCSSRACGR